MEAVGLTYEAFRLRQKPTALAVGLRSSLDKSPGDGTTVTSATIVPSPGDLPAPGGDPTAKAVGYWQIQKITLRFSLASDKLL
jgi:hypothetical protein